MISRNQIRQITLQYLYGISQLPEQENTADQQEGIWNILMEPYRADYCKLKAKAVSGHLTRDYPDKLRLFITRARETAAKLQQDPLTLPVRDMLQDLLGKEGEFNAALLQLKKALHDDPLNEKQTLASAGDAIQNLNTTLLQMRARLTASFRDFPAYEHIWAPLASSCNKLRGINERIDCLIHPKGHASLAEVKQVVEAEQDTAELLREAVSLSDRVLKHQQHLDDRINATLENYTPERVSSIDRIILRLAACELTTDNNIPVPVVVSEALRLAERFSSAEAPRFINGVLAGIVKTARPA